MSELLTALRAAADALERHEKAQPADHIPEVAKMVEQPEPPVLARAAEELDNLAKRLAADVPGATVYAAVGRFGDGQTAHELHLQAGHGAFTVSVPIDNAATITYPALLAELRRQIGGAK